MGMKVGMQTGMSSNMSAAPSPVKQANFAAAPPQQQVVEGQSDMNAVQQVRRPLGLAPSPFSLLLMYVRDDTLPTGGGDDHLPVQSGHGL